MQFFHDIFEVDEILDVDSALGKDGRLVEIIIMCSRTYVVLEDLIRGIKVDDCVIAFDQIEELLHSSAERRLPRTTWTDY